MKEMAWHARPACLAMAKTVAESRPPESKMTARMERRIVATLLSFLSARDGFVRRKRPARDSGVFVPGGRPQHRCAGVDRARVVRRPVELPIVASSSGR